MMESPYRSIQDVIEDEQFPEVDLALRRGRHIDIDDTAAYSFLGEALPFLEKFYRRFGCELIKVSAGYFYLLPAGDRMGRRHLTRGEMLVGQALALIYLDPATVQAAGVVSITQLTELLSNIVGQERLVVALNFRKSTPRDARIAQQSVRKELGKALRTLERLGFVDLLAEDMLRLRVPVVRFADPVRGLTSPEHALQQLIARGEVTVEGADQEEADEANAR